MFMMRIAEKIAEKNGCTMLVTGESLGQVASQTAEALVVTNSAVSMPVMEVADYAVIGDLYKVIPEIINDWDNAEDLYDATTR